MNTIPDQQAGPRQRRCAHSDEFKAGAVAACAQPGTSMAAVAMAHGINANLLRLHPGFQSLLENNLSNKDRVDYLRGLGRAAPQYLARGVTVRQPFRNIRHDIGPGEGCQQLLHGRCPSAGTVDVDGRRSTRRPIRGRRPRLVVREGGTREHRRAGGHFRERLQPASPRDPRRGRTQRPLHRQGRQQHLAVPADRGMRHAASACCCRATRSWRAGPSWPAIASRS